MAGIVGIAAGRLDRKITLERFTETRDSYNEVVKTWATLSTVRASFEPLSDSERFRADAVAANVSARFVIRYSTTVSGLTAKDRLTFEGATYEIVHVKTLGRLDGIEVTAAARADG